MSGVIFACTISYEYVLGNIYISLELMYSNFICIAGVDSHLNIAKL